MRKMLAAIILGIVGFAMLLFASLLAWTARDPGTQANLQVLSIAGLVLMVAAVARVLQLAERGLPESLAPPPERPGYGIGGSSLSDHGYRRSTVATLLACVVALGSCSNPAQIEIDRGQEMANAGRVDEAIVAFNAALELDPDNAEALAGRGCAEIMRFNAAAIVDLDKAIELDPKTFDAYRCRAEARMYAGDFDAALADARKAIELDPTRALAHITHANVLDTMGRTAEAIPEYDNAIATLAKEDDKRALANAYNQRSIARGRLGDNAGESADLDKAIELDPEYGPAYANRAMAELFDGDCERAIADATKAIELEPGFPTAYGARALCLADAGDLDGALNDANRAIELGRIDAFAYWTRGLVYAERGDDAEATADLRRAVELAPTADFADEVRAVMAEYDLE